VHGRVGVVGFATPGCRARTGIAGNLTRVLCSLTLTYMLTLDRDRQIVMSVARFQQLSAGHLRSMLFDDLASQTPLDRALKRLVDRKYLARIERRMVGGKGAGSGQYVYQLGRQGWLLAGREKKYWPFRAVDYHTLAIADAFVEVLELQHRGRIEILNYITEPETRTHIGGVELRPDLTLEVDDLLNGRTVTLWVEVDMGTERLSVIKAKLASYWHAYENAPESLRVFPQVLFLAADNDRAKELRWAVEQGSREAQGLFVVSTVREFAGLYFS